MVAFAFGIGGTGPNLEAVLMLAKDQFCLDNPGTPDANRLRGQAVFL